MVTGSTHARHCATQPIYASVTDNYEFSRIKKFPEFFFQSCKHPDLFWLDSELSYFQLV